MSLTLLRAKRAGLKLCARLEGNPELASGTMLLEFGNIFWFALETFETKKVGEMFEALNGQVIESIQKISYPDYPRRYCL
jgi:hypothetical protein